MSTTATTTYSVTGMTCDHCARAVLEEVGNIPGVITADVDLASGRLDVTSDAALETETVRSAVQEAGYELVTS